MSKRAQPLFMLVFGFFGLLLVGFLSAQNLVHGNIRDSLSFFCGCVLCVAVWRLVFDD